MSEIPESRIRHLEMIQGAVNRMAANSAMLKRFAVAVTAGAIALGGTDAMQACAFMAGLAVVVLVFGVLDAWYLKYERAFRGLYEAVRAEDPTTAADFRMAPWPHRPSVWRTLGSWSVGLLYGPLVVLILLMLPLLNE